MYWGEPQVDKYIILIIMVIFLYIYASIYSWELGRWSKETVELTLSQDTVVVFGLSPVKGVYMYMYCMYTI